MLRIFYAPEKGREMSWIAFFFTESTEPNGEPFKNYHPSSAHIIKAHSGHPCALQAHMVNKINRTLQLDTFHHFSVNPSHSFMGERIRTPPPPLACKFNHQTFIFYFFQSPPREGENQGRRDFRCKCLERNWCRGRPSGNLLVGVGTPCLAANR